MPNAFRTTFSIDPSEKKYSYAQKSIWMGSCFTENLGNYFQNHCFDFIINPFGILYNPISVAKALSQIQRNYTYTLQDLQHENGLYFSYDHHGRFSDPNPDAVLSNINESIKQTHEMLPNADWLFITLGSAYVFEKIDTEAIVANCHKMPGNLFQRRLLSLSEIIFPLSDSIASLLEQIPDLNIVFTISPIRHWRDGAVNNQRSKALLNVAVHQLVEKFGNVTYFPAYEILMDDLRDYRFYDKDMLHPSSVAVNYIQQKFIDTFIDDPTKDILNDIHKLVNARNHKLEYPLSKASVGFVENQINIIDVLKNNLLYPDLSAFETYFNDLLSRKI